MRNFLNQIENIKRKKLMQVFIDLGLFPDIKAHTMCIKLIKLKYKTEKN